MREDLERTIRERAYQLWVAEGCQDGEADRYWLAAEREVLAAFAATTAAPKQRSRAANADIASADRPPAKARRRVAS
jgi:Protein of unknown function (DUF2934)